MHDTHLAAVLIHLLPCHAAQRRNVNSLAGIQSLCDLVKIQSKQVVMVGSTNFVLMMYVHAHPTVQCSPRFMLYFNVQFGVGVVLSLCSGLGQVFKIQALRHT